MLEKNKSKRPFIVDLFKYFPHNNFKISNLIDKQNFEVYSKIKDQLDMKRVIDGNKIEIVNEF